MVRRTSIEAYNEIKKNGLLSQRRWQVYNVLYKYGPLTGGEVFQYMKKEYGYATSIATNSNTTTRLGELRELGCAIELGTRRCSVSGQMVNLWDVTDRLPKHRKKPTKIKCKSCNGRGYIEQEKLL